MSRVAVIGAGLAGVCVVRALAQADKTLGNNTLQVSLFDAHQGPGQGGSAVPIGVVHPLASQDNNLSSQFFLIGVETTLRLLKDLGAEIEGWGELSGVDHRVIGEGATATALHQPGGWVLPGRFIQACLKQALSGLGSRLQLSFGHTLDLHALGSLRESHDAVVVCTASDDLLPSAGLALQPLLGQVSWAETVPHAATVIAQVRKVISGNGFLTPAVSGRVYFGATFHRRPGPPIVTLHDHRRNIEQLHRLAPEVTAPLALQPEACGGWAGVRYATRDRLPHIGQPVCPSVYADPDGFWRLPRSASRLSHLPRHQGIWLLSGMGARGLSSAVLGADAIAAALMELPSPLPTRLQAAVDPARFVLREHTRAKRDASG